MLTTNRKVVYKLNSVKYIPRLYFLQQTLRLILYVVLYLLTIITAEFKLNRFEIGFNHVKCQIIFKLGMNNHFRITHMATRSTYGRVTFN